MFVTSYQLASAYDVSRKLQCNVYSCWYKLHWYFERLCITFSRLFGLLCSVLIVASWCWIPSSLRLFNRIKYCLNKIIHWEAVLSPISSASPLSSSSFLTVQTLQIVNSVTSLTQTLRRGQCVMRSRRSESESLLQRLQSVTSCDE